TLFPITMEKHIIFCAVATVFFLLQFIRTKRIYQLILAIAVPLSLVVYVAPENTTVFYGVGIAEAALLLLAFILSIVQNSRDKKAEKLKQAATGAEG
ncbi:MAG: hypothetical protein IKX57_01105, partial [Oscillospiraceae bacterium]|nr:hypothetical protein [Oscillospiraceae bacterium]